MKEYEKILKNMKTYEINKIIQKSFLFQRLSHPDECSLC